MEKRNSSNDHDNDLSNLPGTSFRNPSPPLELAGLENDEDRIGSTAYSRIFVLNTLKRVMEEIKKEKEVTPVSPEELEGDLETDLCQLWDAAMDGEVCDFLLEHHVCEILCSAIRATNKPRLMEISIGILGNLLCSANGFAAHARDEMLIDQMLTVLRCRDTRSLVEAFRLLGLVVEKSEVWAAWEWKFFDSGTYSEQVLPILASTCDVELIAAIAKFLNDLVEYDECAAKCTSEPALGALLEAVSQIVGEDGAGEALETLANLLRALQTLCSATTAGLECLRLQFQRSIDVLTVALTAILDLMDFDIIDDLTSDHVIALASLGSLLAMLIDSECEGKKDLIDKLKKLHSIKLVNDLALKIGVSHPPSASTTSSEPPSLPQRVNPALLQAFANHWKALMEAIE